MGQVSARKVLEEAPPPAAPAAWEQKRCSCCGVTYATRAAWEALPYVGNADFGHAVLHYRNCPCGSTLALAVER